MRIGLDFDNTIVCYEQAIALLADEVFDLPLEVSRTKLGLRNYLRANGREIEWTEFQGKLYGPGMRYAQPYEGSIEAMQQLAAEGHDLFIISHRSRRPYAGPPHDLHRAALIWVAERLQSNRLFIGGHSTINFLETRNEKVRWISKLRCDAFLDDLPEVLLAQDFPAQTLGIHFDPSGPIVPNLGHPRIRYWSELSGVLESVC